MAERGVADIVSQAGGFDQILIQSQISADGPGHPGHQLNMQHPMGEMVVFNQRKDLGFVYVSGKSQRVEYAVGICTECLPVSGDLILIRPPAHGIIAETSQGIKKLGFPDIQNISDLPGFFSRKVQ